MKRCTCKPNRSRRDGVDQYLTPAGSPSASAFRVGKIIGGDLYIHASALPFLPAPVRDLVVERHAVIDGAPYDLVKWSPKTGAVAFIERVQGCEKTHGLNRGMNRTLGHCLGSM